MANQERQQGLNPLLGREYLKENDDLFSIFDDANRAMSGELNDDQRNEAEGWTNYVLDFVKPGLPFRRYQQIVDSMSVEGKGFGVLHLRPESRSEFDLVGDEGLLIRRGKNIRELAIPIVRFGDNGGVVTPAMVSESLKRIAWFLKTTDDRSRFVIGLTHKRIGDLAQGRWGFQMQERPFTEFSYQFFERAANLPNLYSSDVECVNKFRNQVLVYQPMDEFLKRAT